MSNKTLEHAEQYLKTQLDELQQSWTGEFFRVPRGENFIEELDLDGALEQWIIQPKDDDTTLDIELIHRHNHAIMEALREKGFFIPYDSFWEGEYRPSSFNPEPE